MWPNFGKLSCVVCSGVLVCVVVCVCVVVVLWRCGVSIQNLGVSIQNVPVCTLDFFKDVSGPSNPPDELAQKCFEKKSFLHFFFESSESDRVFNYLHDSNSIFRARGINSEIFFGRTVYGSHPIGNGTSR